MSYRVATRIVFSCVAFFALTGFCSRAAEVAPSVEAELRALATKVPSFTVQPFPDSVGELILLADQSLTIDDLRGVALDDSPPRLLAHAQPYDAQMTDSFPPGDAPYVAQGINPFRFRYFHCEFNYVKSGRPEIRKIILHYAILKIWSFAEEWISDYLVMII